MYMLHALCGGRTAQLVPEERTPPPLLVHLALEASSRRWGGGEETEIPNKREKERDCISRVWDTPLLLVGLVSRHQPRDISPLFTSSSHSASWEKGHRRLGTETTLFPGNGTLVTVTSLRVGDFRSKHQPEDSASIARIYRS